MFRPLRAIFRWDIQLYILKDYLQYNGSVVGTQYLIVYLTWRWPVGAETCSEKENKGGVDVLKLCCDWRHHKEPVLIKCTFSPLSQCQVETDYGPISVSWCWAPSGSHVQIFVAFKQFRSGERTASVSWHSHSSKTPVVNKFIIVSRPSSGMTYKDVVLGLGTGFNEHLHAYSFWIKYTLWAVSDILNYSRYNSIAISQLQSKV
jgi:hypothetical protein